MRKNRDSTSSRDSRRTLGAPSAVRALPAAHLARSSPSARRSCSGTRAGANASAPFVTRVWIAVAAAAAASVLRSATSGADAPAATMISPCVQRMNAARDQAGYGASCRRVRLLLRPIGLRTNARVGPGH